MAQENTYPTNHAYKVNKSLCQSMFFRVSGAIANNAIIGKFVAPLHPIYIIGFDGVRETKGNSSGTTTITLYDSDDNAISHLDFAQASGNNLQSVGVIDTDYNYIDVGGGESFYIKCTAEETTQGQNLNLNVHFIYA
jgi:hypothetical protein